MSNMLMLQYAASRGNHDKNNGNQSDMRGMNDRRNAYDQPDMERYGGMDMRQPNPYPTRSEYEGAENRYRGKDGRWHSGTRRSMGDGDMMAAGDRRTDQYEADTASNRYRSRAGSDDDDEDEQEYNVRVKPRNVIEWPYGNPEEGKNNRQIGFGARNTMDDGHMSPYSSHEMGHGSARMEGEDEILTREMAEKWVREMQPENRNHPIGGKWTPEMIKPIAEKYGIAYGSERFWPFYAAMNAIYSDTSEVAKEFGITSVDYYAKLALAWINDRDAVPNKAAMYYKYIVRH